MVKPAHFGDNHNGISIQYTRRTQSVHVSGWYDSFVGIEGECIDLKEFLTRIGITQKDVLKVFAEKSTTVQNP
jgi:hypothetical protein